LHGGGGPDTVASFGRLFADTHPVHVITPIHPGFGGSYRPEAINTVRSLATLYVGLLDQLDLTSVTVVGNSLGGWIAAELGLLRSPRVSEVVVLDGVGIQVPGHPIADFFSLSMDQILELSFHDASPFRVDLSNLPPAAQAGLAADRATLAVYAGPT